MNENSEFESISRGWVGGGRGSKAPAGPAGIKTRIKGEDFIGSLQFDDFGVVDR
jgi:hypothetical protein